MPTMPIYNHPSSPTLRTCCSYTTTYVIAAEVARSIAFGKKSKTSKTPTTDQIGSSCWHFFFITKQKNQLQPACFGSQVTFIFWLLVFNNKTTNALSLVLSFSVQSLTG